MKNALKTIGFPISHKENEFRRAIVPKHIALMKNPECLWFEKGYGEILGIEDEEYVAQGCHVSLREEVLGRDVICDPKIGDAEYMDKLNKGQVIFGWIHATQNRNITDCIINNGLTAYAWEDMNSRGRHVFWRNNELAGEAAIMHAFRFCGKMPYETKVAVIGRGNVARGVTKVLNMLGAYVVYYGRSNEDLLREELGEYDVIVNCILWDVMRKDHIIYREDLKQMKKGAMIIDVSCDKAGAIETSVPTKIGDPTYTVEGIIHYVVDNTPSLFFKTFTWNNSKLIYPYLEQLIVDEYDDVMKDALIIKDGKVIDQKIISLQNR